MYLEEYYQSILSFDDAIEIDDGYKEAYFNKGLDIFYRLGLAEYFSEEYEESIICFDFAILID